MSTATLQAYRQDLLQLRQWLVGQAISSWPHVDNDLMRQYFLWLDEQGINRRSRARKLSSFRRFFAFARKHGWVEHDPVEHMTPLNPPRRLPGVMTPEMVTRLLLAPDLSTAHGLRDRAMLELMYATGLRVSELVALRLDQLDCERGLVRVFGKGQRERIVIVAERSLALLLRYLQEARPAFQAGAPEDILFRSGKGGAMSRQGFWQRVKHYALQAGLGTRVSPHSLRHAFATHLVDNDADLRVVQLLLGHASLSTTQIYTHVAKQRLQQLHRRHHPRG